MKNRAFTLLELIVTVVIVGILATVAIPFYQNTVESSKEKVCDTNLLALKKAVEIYTIEHDTVPGSLSQLNDKYIEKAYASVMSGKGAWERRLAYLIVEGPQWGLAYAASFGMPRLRCPSNPDPSKVSYGINRAVAGISSSEYKNLPDNTVIVADSAAEVFAYTGAGGSATSWDKSISEVDFSVTAARSGHKKYRILFNHESFLRGVAKDESKGSFTTGSFSPDSS